MLKERLFRLGVDPRVVSSANGHTLLHAACGFGASKVAKLVVRRAVYESHPPFRAFLDTRERRLCRAGHRHERGFERIAGWRTAQGASSGFRSAFDSGSRRIPREYAAARTNATRTRRSTAGVLPAGVRGAHVGVDRILRTSSSQCGRVLVRGAGVCARRRLRERRVGLGASAGRHKQHAARLVTARARVASASPSSRGDRDDYRADLETALRRAERAEAKLANAGRVTGRGRRAFGGGVGRDASRAGRQRAVLAALGLAERRAVRMAAERETLREERDAIAEALAFVKEETKTLFSNTEQEGFLREASGEAARSSETATETSSRADGNRSGIRDPGSGIEPRGGGLGKVPNPERGSSDTGDDTEGTAQMLEVPLGD